MKASSRLAVITVLAGAWVGSASRAQVPVAPGSGGVVVPSGPAAEVQRGYASVKSNILKSADKMPAENYSYKPEPDVRTYARVLNHISEAQLRSCGAVNGTKELYKVPPETADRT